MSKRENIRLDMEALERKVQKHAKKRSTRSQAMSKQYQRVRDSLIGDDDGFWHRPEVSPFHTITGRDQVLGHSLVQ
ncbi:DNA polymerase I, partial [Vibrio anguillarum]|nr:DNA polymerase I [Vibrio anguillarum]